MIVDITLFILVAIVTYKLGRHQGAIEILEARVDTFNKICIDLDNKIFELDYLIAFVRREKRK
jgi:hypothetical protein